MCRIGVHAWSPSHLGCRNSDSMQVAVAGVGEAGDQATPNCVGRLWCPLRPKCWVMSLDELDTITVTRCWYEFWTDSVDEIEDTSTIAPVKRLKRSTAIGAQTVGWGESPMRCWGRDRSSSFPTTTTIHPRPGGAGAHQNRRVPARHTVVRRGAAAFFAAGTTKTALAASAGRKSVAISCGLVAR